MGRAISGILLLALKVVFVPTFSVAANAHRQENAAGFVVVWDADNGEEFLHLEFGNEAVRKADWNAGEARLLIRTDTTVWMVNAINRVELFRWQHNGALLDAIWSSTEAFILTLGIETAWVWDAETGHQIFTLPYDSHYVERRGCLYANEQFIPVWSPDGNRFFTQDLETVHVWDAVEGVEVLSVPYTGVTPVWNPTGDQLLLQGQDTIRTWDTTTGENLITIERQGRYPQAAWSPDGMRLLVWDAETTQVVDALSGSQLAVLSHYENPEHIPPPEITYALWDDSGTRILYWDSSGSGAVWDATSYRKLFDFTFEGFDLKIQWNDAETHILGWSDRDLVYVWDTTTGQQTWHYQPDGSAIVKVLWNAKVSRILVLDNDRQATLIDIATGDMIRTFKFSSTVFQLFSAAQLSPDGRHVDLINQLDHSEVQIHVWDFSTGESVALFTHNQLPLTTNFDAALWSHNGQRIISRVNHSGTDAIKIWDLARGDQNPVVDDRLCVGEYTGMIWSQDDTKVLTWGGMRTDCP